MPSESVPNLTESFARLLSRRLGLPYVPSLEVVPGGEPQSAMQNSTQQVRNASARLVVPAAAGPLPDGPVLLVDDLVDSGWTLTVAGHRLREAGSGPVLPFALAVATAREG